MGIEDEKKPNQPTEGEISEGQDGGLQDNEFAFYTGDPEGKDYSYNRIKLLDDGSFVDTKENNRVLTPEEALEKLEQAMAWHDRLIKKEEESIERHKFWRDKIGAIKNDVKQKK